MENMTFEDLDLGSNPPISVETKPIYVKVGTDCALLGEYARAFVRSAFSVNPQRAEQVSLTEDEMVNYVDFLLTQRIRSINDECKIWRQLKSLYIPCFVQYALSQIGEVLLRDYGLEIIPVLVDPTTKEGQAHPYPETITLEEAQAISRKLAYFRDDLAMVSDAMPRGHQGDIDTMSCILADGYVRSLQRVEHPVSTYLAAFIGNKLVDEQAFAPFYRVQYDDVSYIRSALLNSEKIY